ncbi:MAG TPA: 3-oxoacyl-ACP reductase family protein [Pyrinomonadaceae bacterium]|nr:3-oxoacyl-ACP reductase family protein [Pyrinomonadaceae bacterium]
MTLWRDDFQLTGQVAVVTGGSRGIGRAVAELLAQLGAHVVVNYVNDREAADEVVDLLKANGVDSFAYKADVASVDEAEALINSAKARFGRVDILVCSAGIWEGSPVETLTEELWDKTLNINLKGTWAVCRAAVRVMKQQRSGSIVIVSSTAGQRGEAGYSNYAASKGGQISFVKSLAEELGESHIRVNAVAPGWVDTQMTSEALGDEQRRRRIASEIPIGAIATPDDIAKPIAFLCTSWAKHITGEVLNVNGGSVLCG